MRICPECKGENPPHYMFCLKCGHRLGETTDPPLRIQPVPDSPPEASRCGYCGMKLPDASAARCPHCSAPL
jgi:hypothetical protein